MLLNIGPEKIEEALADLHHAANALTKEIDQIGWYMRGGVGRQEAWMLTARERKNIWDLINQNMENTKKSNLALI